MKIEELIDGGEQTAVNVRAVLNILLESPYFYKTHFYPLLQALKFNILK